MIVFWKQYRRDDWPRDSSDWRCYKGRAKFRNSLLKIYPCNGQRQRLSDYVAFDDKTTPPTLVMRGGAGVEQLVNAGEIAAHLPAKYIDGHGNIRRTDATLSLVMAGPEWDEVKEDEFQTALALLF